MVYRENGQIAFNGKPSSSNFAKPPRLEDLDLARYRQAGFGIGILTKLGDFYYPTAGSDQAQEDAAWRVIRPIEDVVKEVMDLEQRLALRKVFFIDNGFNIPLTHAKSLCHALIEADLKLHWNTCLAPHTCDAELVQLMKRAGCALVLMAGRGGDSHEGTAMVSTWTNCAGCAGFARTETCITPSRRASLSPGETWETVEEKLAFLRDLRPAMANLRVGVRMMPGSPVAALAKSEGLSPTSPS